MHTPKNEEDLVVGLLLYEGIIHKPSEIEKVEFAGDKVSAVEVQKISNVFDEKYSKKVEVEKSVTA